MHLICTPPPHQIFLKFYFSFLRGITAVPREIKNNAYAKFGEQIRCIVGDVQVAYNLKCRGYVCTN